MPLRAFLRHCQKLYNRVKCIKFKLWMLVLLNIFPLLLYLAAIEIKNPVPRIRITEKNSNYLVETGNQTYTAQIGSKSDNAPEIKFSDPNNNQITFRYVTSRDSQPQLTRKSREVTFSNVEEWLDINYIPLENGLKENLILHRYPHKNFFLFEYETNDLVQDKSTKNAVTPKFETKSGEYAFNFEKGYAFDSRGARTEAVRIDTFGKDGKSFLRVIIDDRWLAHKNRKYPVTIDPTVVHDTSSEFSSGSFNRIKDTGSGSSPVLETFYLETPSDVSTTALWHFNETANDTCAGGQDLCDGSGNGLHGVATGTTIDTTTQRIGAASRTFNGTSDFITVSDNDRLSFGNNTMSAELWMKRNGNPSTIEYLILKGITTWEYLMNLTTSGTVTATLTNSAGTTVATVTSLATVTDNNWHHVAFTSTGSTISIYIDGKLSNTSTSFTSTMSNTTSTFYIGDRSDQANAEFEGSIDDIRLSNIARTSQEIRSDASRSPYSTFTSDIIDLSNTSSVWNTFSWNEAGVATGDGETLNSSTNLIAQWNFNQTSGTTATNDAGSCSTSCNGTLTAFSSTGSQDAIVHSGWSSDNRKWGTGALMFDGVNDEVLLGANNLSPKLSGASVVSMGAWFKVNTFPAALQRERIINVYMGNVTSGVSLNVYDLNKVEVGGRSGTGDSYQTATYVLQDPYQWHYLVGIFDFPSDKIQIFIDGLMVSNTTVTFANTTYTPGTPSVQDAIGSGHGIGLFHGVIDSTTIFTRAMTPSEIMSNYQAGNVEFQTRVGTNTSPDDGTWETWKPDNNEVVAFGFDTDSTSVEWNNDPQARPSGDMLLFNSTNIATGNAYTYTKFKSNSTTMTTGDTVEFDVFANNNMFGIGGIDIRYTDGSYARYTGWKDQVNYKCQDEGYQYIHKRWFHRICTIPAEDNGKTVSWFDLVNESNSNTAVSVFYDNIVIKSSSGAIKSVVYTAGNPEFNTIDLSSDAGNTGTVTLASSNNAYNSFFSNDSVIKVQSTGALKIDTKPKVDLNTISLWHLDETGGTGAYIKDSANSANNGTPTGTAVANGIAGKARSFNGSSDLIDVGDGTTLDASSTMTLSVWIKHTGSWPTNEGIIGKRIGTTEYAQYSLGVSSGSLYWLQSSTGTTWQTLVSTTSLPSPDQWHHIVGTNDGTVARLYIDGVEVGSADGSPATSLAASTESLKIGQTRISGANDYFTGQIDEVALYNIAKNSEEIAEMFRQGRDTFIRKSFSSNDITGTLMIPFQIAGDRPGTYIQTSLSESPYINSEADLNTVGEWGLDEISGTGAYIKDTSGNTNHGTPNNTISTQGIYGKARIFNGSNSYVGIPNNSVLSPTNNITVEAWVKTTSTGSNQVILGKSTGCITSGYLLWINQNNLTPGRPNFIVGNTTWLDSNVAVNDGNWHYVVGTYDGTTARIYVDGQLSNSGARSATLSSTTQLQIGGSTTGGGCSGVWFNGSIDEVRVSNVTRSAAEIRQAYEAVLTSHQITIQFGARLSTDDLVTNSSDLGFEVDATYYGLPQQATSLYKGDKIILRENYNGIEYYAQGTVTSVNTSTGSVTVTSWDTGSTFPSGGYSGNADVFKWQREYWTVKNETLSSAWDSLTGVSFRLTDGSEARTVWIDDYRVNSNYMTTPGGSTITSSLGSRYFQYRAILSSWGDYVSPTVTSATLDYTTNTSPATPSLNSPSNAATGQLLRPVLRTTATDAESNYLRYKIELCRDFAMSAGCVTYDQTSSQTGWSGQNTQTSTAYTSGTQAVYTLQSDLLPSTTYYWKTYAIDPGGSNRWSLTQSTPNHFLTNSKPRSTASRALTIYSSRRTSEAVSTTNGWANISGSVDTGTTGSSNGWVSSSNLNGGRRYLIYATGSHSTDNTSGKSGLRVIHGTTTFETSESVDVTDNTTAGYKIPYFWFTVWTAVTGESLEVQQYWNGTGAQSRVEDITLMVIDVDDLITSGDFQYAINTTYTSLTTTLSNVLTHTFTPANNNDIWWVAGYTQTSANNGGAGSKIENQLTVNSTTYSNNNVTINANSLSPILPLGGTLALPNSATTLAIRAKESGSDQVTQANGVFALRLNLFENYLAHENTTGTVMTSSGSWVNQQSVKVVNSFNN
ncbi:LamG domain-containing protein, partial [bacterium]|nr:LamG domain-containing protein [bacterium]